MSDPTEPQFNHVYYDTPLPSLLPPPPFLSVMAVLCWQYESIAKIRGINVIY